jgi:hypothetical protein
VKLSSKRRAAIAAVAILLILFLVRPGVSRLKARIAASISRAVARPVEIGAVQLRFLPRPGFDLENLVIEEDPAFGAEPILRASEVTAVVRVSSLLRGRLDVSRLELTEPSVNLVRSADGRWNLEDLLERTARTPTAPTAKSKSETRPGFPYIEASSGRINFKAGPVKKSYALLDADFALWQESENIWGVRLRAQPLRTDMNLNDAGVLRVNGTWQRAPSLHETPLQFSLEWDRVQLGQLSKLISGSDRGWRGEWRVDATLNGTPAGLQISAESSIDNFRRYDISISSGMRLQAHCDAQYNSAEHMAHEIFCSAPVGNGMMTLHGDAGAIGVHRISLSLNLDNIPANAAAQLALRMKQNLPPDLVASGSVQGDFVVKQDPESGREARLQGRGEIGDLRLQSASNKVEVSPGTVPFVVDSEAHRNSRDKSPRRFAGESVPVTGLRLEYGPFPLALGRPLPAQARGWFGKSGYGLEIRGEAEIANTLRLASLLGVPAIKANVDGVAQMDLLIAGSWTKNVSEGSSNFSAPELTGKAQLHNLRANVRGLGGPVELSSAQMVISPDEVRIDKLNAVAANADWTGLVTLPRNCGTPGACIVNFDLNTEQVALGELKEWLHPAASERRWYQVLASQPAAPSILPTLRASGKIGAAKLLVHNIVANRVSASLNLDRDTLRISDLHANLLGGKYKGDWQFDFAGTSPACTGNGTLTAISLSQVAEAMNDDWVSGTLTGSYQFKSSSLDWQSVDAKLQLDLRTGALPHIALNAGDSPLRIDRWDVQARLHEGEIEIAKGKLVSPSGTYEVSGTASLGRDLDFKLTQGESVNASGAAAYSIQGTLAEPRVALVPAPQTQAQLKP